MHTDTLLIAYGRSVIISRSSLDHSAFGQEHNQTQDCEVGHGVKPSGNWKDNQLASTVPALSSVLRKPGKPPISPSAKKVGFCETSLDSQLEVAADRSTQLKGGRKLRKLDRFRKPDFDMATLDLIGALDSEDE